MFYQRLFRLITAPEQLGDFRTEISNTLLFFSGNVKDKDRVRARGVQVRFFYPFFHARYSFRLFFIRDPHFDSCQPPLLKSGFTGAGVLAIPLHPFSLHHLPQAKINRAHSKDPADTWKTETPAIFGGW